MLARVSGFVHYFFDRNGAGKFDRVSVSIRRRPAGSEREPQGRPIRAVHGGGQTTRWDGAILVPLLSHAGWESTGLRGAGWEVGGSQPIEIVGTGGEGGIRTLGTLAGTTVFETAPIDRSGTSPSHPGTLPSAMAVGGER